MSTQSFLQTGQQQARTRWDTGVSGAAFDRKKTPYLTQQAQTFITQQAMCVLTGLTLENSVDGVLLLEQPGFIEILDASTCLLHFQQVDRANNILQRLLHALTTGQETWVGLFFMCHPTRERLCIHATVEALFKTSASLSSSMITLRLRVREAFFHCTKYIRTSIPGLTVPSSPSSLQELPMFPQWLTDSQPALSEEQRRFLDLQTFCYLCTVNGQGRCAINHRGGRPGFLASYLPTPTVPGGLLILPDYAGNGAFEAIGNIFETKQAALIVPSYVEQVALCISGVAEVTEAKDLQGELAQRCRGAERLIILEVQRVEMQQGDWSITLAHEWTRSASLPTASLSEACVLV